MERNTNMKYSIRPIKSSEIYLLEDFLYNAVFQKDESKPIPRSVVDEPSVKVYIEDYGRPDDLCLVAESDGKVIGCVWTRILDGIVKGFGNLDSETPEFAISVLKDFRGYGIGTALMKTMLELLKKHGFKKTSLAVQKENYAVKMYKKLGFRILRETDEEYIMVCEL
jgi:ribosomal protein S18 acetylase RimI-like enzyme